MSRAAVGRPKSAIRSVHQDPGMNWIIYHFGAGDAIFSGGSVAIIAVIGRWRSRGQWSRLWDLSAIVGMVLAALSGTNSLAWIALYPTTIGWLCFERRLQSKALESRWRGSFRLLVAAWWLL